MKETFVTTRFSQSSLEIIGQANANPKGGLKGSAARLPYADGGRGWECIEWRGLYGKGWGAEIVPEAFSHPAKYSRALIRRIYQEMLDRGWLAEGDSVIDPFGGVALGGLDAMLAGLNWIGVELEPRFVTLGQANIDLWNRRYAAQMPHWGTARIVQGDSRKLRQVLAEAGALVSSPPYVASVNQSDGANDSDARLARKAKAGVDVSQAVRRGGPNSVQNRPQVYGNMAGQLGAMPEGDAAISSPPFLQSSGGVGVRASAAPGSPTADPRLMARHAAGNAAAEAYGADAGNLGNMREGDAAVSSPPYESNDQRGGHTAVAAEKHVATHGYGDTPGNVGNSTGDTFWTATRAIVAETFAVLRPGAHAAWVVKGFVRKRKLVDFPDQWRQLCESVGFVTVAEVRAWVVEDKGTQLAMHGDDKRHVVSRKSFFRRLAEKKGSPEINWETVWLMGKPA